MCGGGGANYGWGFIVPRYHSGGGGRCTLQAQYERQGGGGGLLSGREGTLHERATL